MTDPTPSIPTLDDHQALDHFIASRAPAWLKAASHADLEALRESLASHQRYQAQVATLLADIQSIEDFAVPPLSQALREVSGCDAQLRQVLWRDVYLRVEFPVFRVTDIDLPVFRHYTRDSDLLARLLQNFSEDQADASGYYPGAGIVEAGKLLACAPEQVAALCRELDLGGKYQAHLEQVLTPVDPARRQQVLDLLGADKRATLVAQARCSRLKGDIEASALALALAFAANPAQAAVRSHTLQVLGFAVPGSLLLEVSGQPWQLLLFLPNDPLAALRQFASWSELNDALASALKDNGYVDFLTRQCNRDDRLSFLAKLGPVLGQPRPQLEVRGLASGPQPFERLAQQQIERIKADAGSLVVPTAAVDQALHRQRVQALESAGLSVAGVLASFIPGIGEMMLVGLVKDVLTEVYEGVAEWSHGQRNEALEHLLGVVGNVALSALVGAGSALAVRALQRSAFVDSLLPVVRGDGGQCLWSPDRASYRTVLSLPQAADADGLLRVQGRHWWRSEEQLFEVRQDASSQRWGIVHPARADAWAPELVGNGDGAWWHTGEHPLQWQGSAYLVRRLGPRAAGLSTEACEQAALICGYDEAQLRGLLVERRPMPVALVQVLGHFSLDARVAGFFQQIARGAALDTLDPQLCEGARELLGRAAPETAETLAWKSAADGLRPRLFEWAAQRSRPLLGAAGQRLQRAFPGLPEAFVETLLEDIDSSAWARDGHIPLAVQEQARLMLREVRVMRALEGLYLDSLCGSDTVRMVFSLLRQWPHWPRGLTFELRDGTATGPVLERLLPADEAGEVKLLVGGQGRFEAFDARGLSLGARAGEPVDLYQALLDGLGAEACERLGWTGQDAGQALRTLLRTRAGEDRQRLPGLLGMTARSSYFQSPQRLADGRLGYPLSGRGAVGRTSLTSMVRSLYPGFDDLQVEAWLDDLRQRQRDPLGELLRVQESQRLLDGALQIWLLQAPLMMLRGTRRRMAQEISRCWSRQTPAVRDGDGRIIGYRLRLERVFGGDLPALPEAVDFSHVVDLRLSGAGQSNQVDAFLRHFTGLQWLDLGQNSCTDIPAALASMPGLRELYLDGNRIQLSASGQDTLSALSRLEVLNLDRNALLRGLDVSQLPRLRRLSVRGSSVSALPHGLLSRPFLESADLRGNRLTTLPEAFFDASPRTRNALVLYGNPLSMAVRERLSEVIEEDGLSSHSSETGGVREQWLAGMQEGLLRERDQQWQSLSAEPGSQAFFGLLGDLLDTAEYRLAPTHLQGRVWQMIGAAVESSELRESLFQMANAPTTCVDSVLTSFSGLEVRLEVSQARARALSGDHGSALVQFARRLFRLDRVEQHARTVIEQRRTLGLSVDEVEISLAFRVGLREELALPGQPRYMEFGDIAAVNDRELAEARRVVREAEAGPGLAVYIARQDFWLEYLRSRQAAAFSQVENEFWERLERLDEQQADLPEGDYLRRMNQLASDRDAALAERARMLTEEALANAGEH